MDGVIQISKSRKVSLPEGISEDFFDVLNETVSNYEDVFEKGADLFESIAKNHCFQNANIRTAFVSLLQFLSYNNYLFTMDQKEAEDFVSGVVTHKYDFNELVNVIQKNSVKKD